MDGVAPGFAEPRVPVPLAARAGGGSGGGGGGGGGEGARAAAASILREIVAALRHAYENDVVHRDVKPENIVLALGGAEEAEGARARGARRTASGGRIDFPCAARLIDWGTAKDLRDPTHNGATECVGTAE
jgi:serine/threonine protein kinase